LTETLETPSVDLTTGSTFAGRYQIIEELGAGGMGRVFKAFDTQVKEKVALKLIRPEIAADLKTIERFRNELKLARRIRHPRVCQMFDLGQEKGAYFITMEYVSGEDLKSFLRRSRELAVGTAVSIARQVCEGLAEAHKTGVVHRDLKPSNIMIDREGCVRIMDFGIARSLGAKGTTGAGVMIGTPEYMSPEQVEGRETDRRSDIYALGVILFEMVTGRLPFEGDTALSIAVKHKTELPPDPRELAPKIPHGLGELILSCLEKDRDKRPQTADDLAAGLVKIEQVLPKVAPRPAMRPSTRPKSSTSREITVTFGLKKAAIISLAFIALIAVILFVWKPWRGSPEPILPQDKATLAILDFENTSRDETLDDWKTGLPRLLTADLSQSRYLSVLGYDQVSGILDRLGLRDKRSFTSSDIARIAREGRVAHTVTGSIMRAGERIIIVISVKAQETGEDQPAKFECSGEEAILSMVDQMTPQIKEMLGLTRSRISGDLDGLTVDLTTSSWEAFKFYNEARRLHMAGEYDKSVPLLLEAVEKDPRFALAYRALSAALRSLNRTEEANTYAKKAFELRDRASPQERFWIQAYYYEGSETTYDQALETCLEWHNQYPDDTAAMIWAGILYLEEEDFDQAAKFLEMNLQGGGINPYGYSYLASVYNLSGAYDKGTQTAMDGLAVLPGNSLIMAALIDGFISQGKIDEARAQLGKRMANSSDLEVDLRVGALAVIEGRYEEEAALYAKYNPQNRLVLSRLALKNLAEGRMEQAVDLARLLPDHLLLAYLDFRRGRFLEALAESDKAVQEALMQGSFRQRVRALHLRGLIHLATGSLDAAVRTAGDLEACVKQSPFPKYMRYYDLLRGMIDQEAEIYPLAIDRINRAIALLPSELYGPSESYREGDQGHPLFIDGLAGTYFKAGDMARAEEAYRRIQSLVVGKLRYGNIYATSFYWLGRIAEKRGEREEAMKCYRQFLDLWKNADAGLPELEDAKSRLAGLNAN
jgi:serine/threonine protein kinase/tetratricopeptide (TPR) repeat protein